MITINDVRDSVIAALKKHFPTMTIYGEEIKQGFKVPCFFVKLFPVSQNREVGRRYKRFHSFDIHYFPKSKTDANEEMQDMAEQLFEKMEFIEVGDDLCRGSNMNSEIIDGVLHFFVDLDFHVMRQAQEEMKMQTLKQEGYIRE